MTEREKNIFNYGIIVGIPETISRFNDKTDHAYDFNLTVLPKSGTIYETIDNIVIDVSESYNLTKIENQNAFKFFCNLLHDKWFYEYQNKNEYHLSDIGDNFSLSFEHWKKEWVDDFVKFLLNTLHPINVYEIHYINLKSYYVSDYDEYIFECEDEIYHFKLHVTD